MKKAHLHNLLFTLLLVSSGYAQLTIDTSGKIGLGSYSPNTNYSLIGSSSHFYHTYASFGYVYESLGIGTSSSWNYALKIQPNRDVSNVVYISDPYNRSLGQTLYVNGDAYSTGGWNSYSDRRLKRNERSINSENLLTQLSKIRGKQYEFKTDAELLSMHRSGVAHFPVDTIYILEDRIDKAGNTFQLPTDKIDQIVVDLPKFKKGSRYGLIAQEVLTVFPELVTQDESSGMYVVDYQGFIPILLEAYQLQQVEIKVIKRKMEDLHQ